MKSPRKVRHSVVAFYGIDNNKSVLKATYARSLDWFRKFALRPDLIGTNLTKKVVDFSRLEKTMPSKLSELHRFGIYSLPEGVESLWDGVNLEVGINLDIKCFRLSFDSSILAIGAPPLLEICKEIVEVLNPNYGIGFTRIFGLGPSLYAMGVIFGDICALSDKEKVKIGKWGSYGMEKEVFRAGMLRDVYPWNFLSNSQLKAKRQNQTLEEWIGERRGRGILSRLTKGMFLWSLDEQEIPAVRKAMYKADRIFDYERHVEMLQEQEGAPLSGEQVLADVFKAYGIQSGAAVDVLKVERKGGTRKMSKEEIGKIITRSHKKK